MPQAVQFVLAARLVGAAPLRTGQRAVISVRRASARAMKPANAATLPLIAPIKASSLMTPRIAGRAEITQQSQQSAWCARKTPICISSASELGGADRRQHGARCAYQDFSAPSAIPTTAEEAGGWAVYLCVVSAHLNAHICGCRHAPVAGIAMLEGSQQQEPSISYNPIS
jgi:hypothetical protein